MNQLVTIVASKVVCACHRRVEPLAYLLSFFSNLNILQIVSCNRLEQVLYFHCWGFGFGWYNIATITALLNFQKKWWAWFGPLKEAYHLVWWALIQANHPENEVSHKCWIIESLTHIFLHKFVKLINLACSKGKVSRDTVLAKLPHLKNIKL